MKNKQILDNNNPQYSSLWEKALANKRSKYHKMPVDADMNCIVKSERIESPDGDTNRFCWKHEHIRQDGLVNKTQTRHYRKQKNEWGQYQTIEVDANGNELKKRR